MSTTVRFLIGAGLFGLVTAAAYWFVSYEDAGTALLLFMGIAVAFVGAYLVVRSGKVKAAEDDPEADHEKQAGQRVGYFASGSVWPLVMGAGIAVGLQGFIFGAWLVFFGLVLFLWAAIGLMMESRG
jgi:Na+/H+ antiporter NhaB